MTRRDPLASPTLALLYIMQGHRTHAREVVEEVLGRDPRDGHALALRDRLRAHSEAILSCTDAGDALLVTWQRAPAGRDLHVLISVFVETGTGLQTFVTSTRCTSAVGSWRVSRPARPGSACACVGRLGEDGLEILTVARPVSW